MNLENAIRASEDAMSDERMREFEWLANAAKDKKRIVEVGSFKGATTCVLADNTRGMVYAVDHFKGSVETTMQQMLAEHEEGWLEKTFRRNTAHLGNLFVYKMTSEEAANLAIAKKMQFDMIFLDAAHDYESVKQDIRLWSQVLMPLGLLCGHDRSWEGVKKALDELISPYRVGAGAIWYKQI